MPLKQYPPSVLESLDAIAENLSKLVNTMTINNEKLAASQSKLNVAITNFIATQNTRLSAIITNTATHDNTMAQVLITSASQNANIETISEDHPTINMTTENRVTTIPNTEMTK
ncbi:hypothetical protein Tco_1552430, partial [Tanacetum coccineum]